MHRHVRDFDAFRTDLVLDRTAQLETQASMLRASAGTSRVADNLTAALITLFGPVPLAIIPLITAVSDYLVEERELGRIAADADIARRRPC